MKKSIQPIQLIFQISCILILLAAIFYYFNHAVVRYMMIVGVIGFVVTTFKSPYPGKSIRGKRLFNIQVFAAVVLVVNAYLMYVGMGEWIVALLISALLTLYASLMMHAEYRKEMKAKDTSDK